MNMSKSDIFVNRKEKKCVHIRKVEVILLTLIVLGGGRGLFTPCDAKFRRKKCPCAYNDNNALIKQISLFETALVITNDEYLKF